MAMKNGKFQFIFASLYLRDYIQWNEKQFPQIFRAPMFFAWISTMLFEFPNLEDLSQ